MIDPDDPSSFMLNGADANPSACESRAMNLHPINPPVRVLIRTRPAELQKFEPSLYKADSILIDELCARREEGKRASGYYL